MKVLLFIFSLAIINGGCADWTKVDEFQQFLSTIKIDIENFINSTLNVVESTTGKSSDVMNEIDKWPMPWEKAYNKRANCSIELFSREQLKQMYLVNLRALSEPVTKRIVYLRKLQAEISSSLSMTMSTARFKNQSCAIFNDDCYEKIDSWIEDNISALKCKIAKDCQKLRNHQQKSVAKRSLTDCTSNQFKCRNGKCIKADNVCGGAWTCDDGSDETPQCQKYCFNGFHCQNLKCIDKLLVCNNNDDCGDNSDELGCVVKPMNSSHNCNFEQGMFLCKNYNCIPLSATCDGADGCGDGSDEGGLCGSGCPGRCEDLSGVCLTTPEGPVCLNKCPSGHVPTAAGCRPPPEPLPTTVEEMVEEMSGAVARYISSLYQLKQEIFSRMSKASQDFLRCYGDQEFNKITRLTNFNETYDSNNNNIKKD